MAREVRFGIGKVRKLRRGLAFLREARFEEAVAQLEPLAGRGAVSGARRDESLRSSVQRHLAAAHRQAGMNDLRARRLPQARGHLQRAAELLGPCPEVADALAQIDALTGRFDRCAEELQRALPKREKDAVAWRKLAQAQWRSGRRAEAHMTLDTATRQLGDRCDLHLQQGLFYTAEGLLPEARQAFTRAAEADPDCAEAHHYLGLAAGAMGNCREAVDSLQRAADLRPRQKLVLYQLALAARAARQAGIGVPMRLSSLRGLAQDAEEPAFPVELIEATLKSYQGRVAAAPSEPAPTPTRAAAGPEERGQLESLLGAVRAMLARAPHRAELHGYCADALEMLGKPEEALPYASQAAELATEAAPLVRLGKLCAKLGRREEAVAHLDSAVRKGADWADVHVLLAELLAAMGRNPEARSHLKRALEQNTNLRIAEPLRARLAA